MISDEPDEDADALDDDDLLENYLVPDKPMRDLPNREDGDNVGDVRDWPPADGSVSGPKLDSQTIAWFKVNHADGMLGIESVLKGWIAAHAQALSDTQP
jgi:hypothetical protein